MADNCVHLVRQAARASGGPAYFFHAPLLVPNAATARAMRRQPEIARAFAQMRAIPEVIAIAYGVAKAPAVGAAIRSGLVNGLVTHSTLAAALLDG